jgi:hypothetical protein
VSRSSRSRLKKGLTPSATRIAPLEESTSSTETSHLHQLTGKPPSSAIGVKLTENSEELPSRLPYPGGGLDWNGCLLRNETPASEEARAQWFCFCFYISPDIFFFYDVFLMVGSEGAGPTELLVAFSISRRTPVHTADWAAKLDWRGLKIF